jgi:ubiquinone/menaquinone biosynthesis C-methylase UbiE
MRDEDGPMAKTAAYDAYADWYEAYLTGAAARHTERTTAALCAALGPGSDVCLDLGCGTGAHAAGLQALGWKVVGIDLSPGQLRHARRRLPVLVADVSSLPFPARAVDVVVATLIHTDVENWSETSREVARVLRPGGRFVYVGVHPCFVGPFAERADSEVRIHPGYTRAGLTFEGPGIGDGIRPRVGVWHRPLAEVINAVVQAGLSLIRVEELAEGPTPDLLVLEARA